MTIDIVRDVVTRHHDGLIPIQEVRGLAHELEGPVCLLCLEMARLTYWLSVESPEEDLRPMFLETCGDFISRVITEAKEPQP